MSRSAALPQDFLDAFRLGLHDRLCRPTCPNRIDCSYMWVMHTVLAPLEAAVVHLRQNPRDAAGARMILHDGHCASDHCGGYDHATRFAPQVTVLRRLLAGDKMAA